MGNVPHRLALYLGSNALMRFVLNIDQAIAVFGLMVCAGAGWKLGAWLTGKVLGALKLG